jgi:hypothetical protein
MFVNQGKCAESVFIIEVFTKPATAKSGGSVTVLLSSWNFTWYCMHLILGEVPAFKSTPYPVARSLCFGM